VTTSYPLSAWVAASTVNATQTGIDNQAHSAVWVSDANDGGGQSDVNGQEYVYTDTFTVDPNFNGPGVIALTGTISSDNWIPQPDSPTISGLPFTAGVTLNGLPVTLTGGSSLGQETMYAYTFNALLTPTNFTSPTTFTLSVDVVNSFEATTNGQNPGPTGLILAGTAIVNPAAGSAPVPLPAAGLGFSMLGGFVAIGSLRKRFKRTAQIA
jgi:hypothetical protein